MSSPVINTRYSKSQTRAASMIVKPVGPSSEDLLKRQKIENEKKALKNAKKNNISKIIIKLNSNKDLFRGFSNFLNGKGRAASAKQLKKF